MAVKVAINGLGRIGRCVARIVADRDDLELVAVNASGAENIIEYGLKYDSVHGTRKDVSVKDGFVNITIDPALAFGTGHHPTTSTCLSAISKYVKKNNEVCDVGCGSGILAIGAIKLGAIVDACDTDEVSIANAKENAKLNGVSYRQIWQGSINKTDKKYDVVIANIVADVLVFLAKDLKNALNDKDSIMILSGILDKYEQKVLDAYKDCDLVEKIAQDEWVSLVLKRK